MKQKLTVTAGLVMALLFSLTSVQAQDRKPATGEQNGYPKVVSIDAPNTGESTIAYSEGGHRYKVKVKGTAIAELYIDDRKVPAGDHSKYEPTVKRILEQMDRDRQMMEKEQSQRKQKEMEQGKQQVEVNELKEKGSRGG